ncbi:hypothetical protein G5C60_42700 [Streptomyces sp. HC44]|uniref:Uncharacterized protein n=1 Tax=Streptomyces scabichelini TaxID=2711217 RepID=A0A6G4VK02_9ACTN|nr:hypothetical protein [Streptomyces scabichelini]NGO14130.1 hypothetical protein [Streptomyces scabichelini]
MVLGAEGAARLAARATRRRSDGSRRLWARRAWRRLVRRCAEGDPAVQDAVRAMAAELTEADVRNLLAAAPQEPADAAAYLALIGQSAQSRALDPEGSLLALAYRAAPADLRERLRTVMATDVDTDVIRVVVTGDRRDRIAEMSYDELDYLGHQLAEHRRWDELRRLAHDLPLAKAVAAARLLPERERHVGAGNETIAVPAALAERSAGQLHAMIDRLPRDHLITHRTRGSRAAASFSPDGSELALGCATWKSWNNVKFDVETLRLDTGRTTRHFSGKTGAGDGESVLHLGDEIIVRLQETYKHYRIIRVFPDHQSLCPPSELSDIRRLSAGAVMISSTGLAFADPGADQLRYEPFPRPGEKQRDLTPSTVYEASFALTTLPESRLIAFVYHWEFHVLSESGEKVLHTAKWQDKNDGQYSPALSFLSPRSLALHHFLEEGHQTEIWELPAKGRPNRTAKHEGAVLDRWPLEEWTGLPLDHSFTARMLSPGADSAHSGPIDKDLSWLQSPDPDSPTPADREFLALAPWGDKLATITRVGAGSICEVHIPHLPSARELLEQPLLHRGPQDVRRVRELRTKIGDPAVRDALDLLAACLEERFGGDIALGSGPVAAGGGATDIALGDDGNG